jgi:hypothetical protein
LGVIDKIFWGNKEHLASSPSVYGQFFEFGYVLVDKNREGAAATQGGTTASVVTG